MAAELYKPFIIRKLIEKRYCKNSKRSFLRRIIKIKKNQLFGILEKCIKGTQFLLNRSSLHYTVWVIHRAVSNLIHWRKSNSFTPISNVLLAFNADFDGDQMAGCIYLLEPEAIPRMSNY